MDVNADLVIAGAGLYGLTIANRAAECGFRVRIIEKRSHIGGNAYSEIDPETGIEVHKYGSHIFHCSSEEIWNYVNKFAKFNDYRHRVFTVCKGKVYPMPVNLETISLFLGKYCTPKEAKAWISDQIKQEGISNPKNLEEKSVSLIGRPLYEAFIRGYTLKQWQTNPLDLPSSTISRLPVRFNFDGRYFSDRFEGIPWDGYTKLMENMIAHENIHIVTGCDFFSIRKDIPDTTPVIYTGPIDRFYDYKYGILGWRTLDFAKEVHACSDYQGTSVVNYADEEVPYTRIHEFHHYHKERQRQTEATIIFKEFSRASSFHDEPYYPISTASDRKTFDRYWNDSAQERNVLFGGRLGTYKYLDMHQAIGSALKDFDNRVLPCLRGGKPLGLEAMPIRQLGKEEAF